MRTVGKIKAVLPDRDIQFPRLRNFGTTSGAVNQAEQNIQAPREMILCSALSAMSLAIQGLYDVIKPNEQVVPCSIYILTIAGSGGRKSTVERVFFQAVRDVEGEYKDTYKNKEGRWRAACKSIDAQIRSVQKMIDKKIAKNECVESELARLEELELSRPLKPKKFKLLYDDSTSEALFLGLSEDVCSGGLVSSEGGSILNGRGFKDKPKLNSMWSGDSIVIDRKSCESIELCDARLTVSIMAQESALKEYMQRCGEESRGSGLLARFLVCYPKSNQGERFIDDSIHFWEYCEIFEARLKKLLRANMALLDDPTCPRKTVQFSEQACELWIGIYNAIEYEIRVGGRFEGMADHASKLADNIARVAALLHVFEGFSGDISRDTLKCAIDICFKCSSDFEYLFMPIPQEVMDADELNDWLYNYRRWGEFTIAKNFIRQSGPSCIRNKIRLDKALEELYRRNEIRFYREGNKQYIDLRWM